MPPKLKIFEYREKYELIHEFEMERAKNPGGISLEKYMMQALSMNHLTSPVMVHAIHLTPEGIELYISTKMLGLG